jgi:hypothetical protein
MLRRVVVAFAGLSLAFAAPAFAEIYEFPAHLTGTSSTTPVSHRMPSGEIVSGFVVRVKTNAGVPISGRTIHLDLSVAPLTLKMYASQPANLTVACSIERVSATTNANGDAVFAVRFGGGSDAFDRPRFVDDATGYSGFMTACSTDIDASGSTGMPDYSYYAAVYLWQGYDPLCDFDADGVTFNDLGDYAIFTDAFLYGVTSSLCP